MPPTQTKSKATRVRTYQLKVTLVGAKPPIWRRLHVPGNYTLGDLHDVLQVAMGWHGGHLHAFTRGRVQYGNPDEDWGDIHDEHAFPLQEVAPRVKTVMHYEYDFGDGWRHKIVVEKFVDDSQAPSYPVCVTGKRACPPEDCGGVWGYEMILAALADPENEANAERLEWVGDNYDPDDLDLKAINVRLSKMFQNA